MVTPHKNNLYGNKSFLFRDDPSRRLSEEVWVKHYTLVAADSFETGSAYSLHLTRKESLKFKSPFHWYQSTGEPEIAYVSPTNLEKILKEKKHAVFQIDD